MYRLAILNVPRRLRVACRGHNVERRGYLTLGLGDCAPPPPPRPLSLDRQRKGGKKARPWRTSQGLLPATRYALLTHLPAHGRSGSRTRRPSPKSPAARRLPPGAKKTLRRPPRCGHVLPGGGIFALRRPRPYSRHCEEIVAGYAAPTIVYAHIGINWSDEWEDNDAARRVATSSGKRGNRI